MEASANASDLDDSALGTDSQEKHSERLLDCMPITTYHSLAEIHVHFAADHRAASR